MKNKRNKEKVKRKVLDFLTDMEWMFDYQNFDRSVVFKDCDHPTRDVACEVITNIEYRRITINVFPSFF